MREGRSRTMPALFDMKMIKFYDTLMIIEDFGERIEFLATTDFNFFMEADTDTILEYFKDVSGYEEATKLAQAVEQKMGNLVLCRDRSYDFERFMTILDVLDDLAEYLNEAGANSKITFSRY